MTYFNKVIFYAQLKILEKMWFSCNIFDISMSRPWIIAVWSSMILIFSSLQNNFEDLEYKMKVIENDMKKNREVCFALFNLSTFIKNREKKIFAYLCCLIDIWWTFFDLNLTVFSHTSSLVYDTNEAKFWSSS